MPPLPPPFEWPSRRMVRLERVWGPVFLAIPAGLLVLLYARARPAFPVLAVGPIVLLAILAPLCVEMLRLEGRGLLLSAIRGGAHPVIEVRPRKGGPGLILPLSSALAQDQPFWLGLQRTAYVEAVALTSVGPVCIARGGQRLDPALVRWLEALPDAQGVGQPHPTSKDVEEIAVAAIGGVEAPVGLELVRRGWPRIRYRGRERSDARSALFVLAGVVAAWLSLSLAIPAVKLLPFFAPPALLTVYWLLWAGPVIIELEVRGPITLVRRKRFGLTLSISLNKTSAIGLDLTQLPFVGLRFGRRLRGFTSSSVGGLDASGLAWATALVRSGGLRQQEGDGD